MKAAKTLTLGAGLCDSVNSVVFRAIGNRMAILTVIFGESSIFRVL